MVDRIKIVHAGPIPIIRLNVIYIKIISNSNTFPVRRIDCTYILTQKRFIVPMRHFPYGQQCIICFQDKTMCIFDVKHFHSERGWVNVAERLDALKWIKWVRYQKNQISFPKQHLWADLCLWAALWWTSVAGANPIPVVQLLQGPVTGEMSSQPWLLFKCPWARQWRFLVSNQQWQTVDAFEEGDPGKWIQSTQRTQRGTLTFDNLFSTGSVLIQK